MLFLIATIVTLPYCLAFPGYYGGHKLQTVPEEESYGKIRYPHYDIIEFGDYQKSEIPPKVINVVKKIVIKEPKPYPVKVPYHVPYPVVQKVPYPVVNKEIVKVPEPVPFPVIKAVHIPVEVAKPYPVPSHEYQGHSTEDDQSSYGGDASGINQVNYSQNDANSIGHEENYQQESWKPLGLDQYQKLSDYIHHQQIGPGEDVSSQHSLEERPVHEDQENAYGN